MFMFDWDLKDIINSRHSPSKYPQLISLSPELNSYFVCFYKLDNPSISQHLFFKKYVLTFCLKSLFWYWLWMVCILLYIEDEISSGAFWFYVNTTYFPDDMQFRMLDTPFDEWVKPILAQLSTFTISEPVKNC